MEDGRRAADTDLVTAHRTAGWFVAAAVGLAVMFGARGATVPAVSAPGEISDERLAATFDFEDVSEADRATVLAAIAAARPEVRALIERVDGLVRVRVGPVPGGNAGLTEGNPTRGYVVTLDLAGVMRTNGDRGIRRLVHHELGHVVDHALLTPERQAALDAGIPTGYSPAPREERFAETFAKWATGDIGVSVHLGYRVLPPPSLDEWGRGLDGV